MKIPTIRGIIDRRILINYAVDPDIVKQIVPAPFSPKVINGKAIVGICLIRLKNIRLKGLPPFLGFGSENGAHRIAVEWAEGDEQKEGVYVPRRDTSLRFNALVGGRLFPGKHHYAKFDVKEDEQNYHVAFKSSDNTIISIDAKITDLFNSQPVFKDLSTASAFFKAPTRHPLHISASLLKQNSASAPKPLPQFSDQRCRPQDFVPSRVGPITSAPAIASLSCRPLSA